jgi:putative mycofactocin binding protein MftB
MTEDALLAEAWELSPEVSLRHERFGALAYHYGNRRLTFLKSPALVDVVTGLAQSVDLGGTLQRAGVPRADWPAYVEALHRLAEADLIRMRRPEEPS